MSKYKIDFESMPWDTSQNGIRFKQKRIGNHRVRLVEYNGDYTEQHWCQLAHTGMVLEGTIQIQYEDESVTYHKGDGILIMGGKQSRHKANVEAGKKAILLLFEPN